MMTKKFDLWNDFDRLMPPGMTFNRAFRAFLTVLLLGVCVWWAGIFSYLAELGNLKINLAQGVYENFPMPHISSVRELMHLTVLVFVTGAQIQLFFVIENYQYFRKDSKSIYTMRRVDDPRLMIKQCWTVPLIGCAVTLLALVLLYGIFCLIYFLSVPAEALPEQTIGIFWRYVP